MPNTRTIYRRQRKRPSQSLDGVDPVARTYERGREAPFSPRSPEIADSNSPAVVEVKRRAEAGNVSKSGATDAHKPEAGTTAGKRKPRRSVH
jgi:hypothetical protein